MWLRQTLAFAVVVLLQAAALSSSAQQIESGAHDGEAIAVVFGSFSSQDNAARWAADVARQLSTDVGVERIENGLYRVKTAPLDVTSANRLLRLARERGLDAWRLRPKSSAVVAGEAVSDPAAIPQEVVEPVPSQLSADAKTEPERDVVPALESPSSSSTPQHHSPPRALPQAPQQRSSTPADKRASRPAPLPAPLSVEWHSEIGAENRVFARTGASGQDRWAPSLSLEASLFVASGDERWSFTATPHLRLDAQDGRRNRFDLREFYVSRVGGRWEAHLGAKQVFWGVTEFSHLVDVINQTDLVENIDGEDKLGQPMLAISRVTDWGIVDLYALLGARERTFPGAEGRLRTIAPVATGHARFDSGAGRERVDTAIRWTHFMGPAEVGLYHFSGTSREPILEPVLSAGEWQLIPRYTTIDQTGIDAQYLFGDTALKLEAIRRSGFGDTYVAANVGVEHTLVGAFGGRSDLGLVLEYLWDERGDEAFNTVFERDIAIGSRWQFNDAADTHALFGIIWDPSTDESQYSLEAGRRLGDLWSLNLEARVFSGDDPDSTDVLATLLDSDRKLSSVTQDDYLQLEVVRYF
ncbi:MAG: hypothetical protein NXH85_05580 [Pseudomonadaceae bacterium]|nr:hypothetical protein [Pseudomonadaceae bacterium]